MKVREKALAKLVTNEDLANMPISRQETVAIRMQRGSSMSAR